MVVSLYDHEVPRSVLWWALQAAITVLMVAGGTWACRWRELRPMSFGLGEQGTCGEYEMVPVPTEEEEEEESQVATKSGESSGV